MGRIPTEEIDFESLADQTSSVWSKEVEVQTQLSDPIKECRATPEQAEEWWRGFDPLFESDTIRQETFRHTRNPKLKQEIAASTFSQTKTADYAAITLLVGLIYPDVFDGSPEDWPERLQERLVLDRVIEPGDETSEPTLVQMHALLERFSPSTYEEMEQLSLISEIMHFSRINYETCIQLGILGEERPGLLELFREQTIDRQKDISSAISNLLAPQSSRSESEFQTTEESDKTRLLGLNTRMKQLSEYDSSTAEDFYDQRGLDPTRFLENRTKLLGIYLGELEHVFSGDDGTIRERLGRPHVVGQLHELMFFLDIVMMKHMYPEDYNHVVIRPSFHSEDRPRIGRPHNPRSYDFALVKYNDRYGQIITPVQLKSAKQQGKPHEKKPYHPAILVLEEQPFKERQAKRLDAKLAAYRRIYDNGFAAEDRELLDKYVMESSKVALDDITHAQKSRSLEIVERIMDVLKKRRLPQAVIEAAARPDFGKNGSLPPNRTQRRKQAKEEAKRQRKQFQKRNRRHN